MSREYNLSDVNPDSEPTYEEIRNKAGGRGFEPEDARLKLTKLVLNNLLEDTYYTSVDEQAVELQAAFEMVAETDPEYVLKLAVYVRQEEGLRDIAQLLLVLSANDDRTKEFVPEYTPSIIDRTDEFCTVIDLQLHYIGSNPNRYLQAGIEDAWHKKYVIVKVGYSGTSETERVTAIENTPNAHIKRKAIERVLDRNNIVASGGGDPLDIKGVSGEIVDEGYIHDEYTVSKYRNADSRTSLWDVLNVCGPTPRSENRDKLFERIVKGELDEYPDVERLRQDRTWEAERSSETTTFVFDDEELSLNTTVEKGPVTLRIGDDATPHYEIEGNGKIVDYTWDGVEMEARIEAKLTEEQEWRHRLDDMGLFARIRNLRNMRQAGLSGEEIFDYDGGFFGPESERIVANSKVLPFRFYQAFAACEREEDESDPFPSLRNISAFDVTEETSLLDETSRSWLTGAIDTASQNMPESLDNTLVAVDLSGSMDSPISSHSTITAAEIGSLFASMMLDNDADSVAFASDVGVLNSNPTSNVLERAKWIYDVGDKIGNSTHGDKVINYCIEEDASYDSIIFLTDMQMYSQTGGLFSSADSSLKTAWDEYQRNVNPEASLITIDLQNEGQLLNPESDGSVTHIQGWSSNVIDYLDAFADGGSSLVDEIQAVSAADY